MKTLATKTLAALSPGEAEKLLTDLVNIPDLPDPSQFPDASQFDDPLSWTPLAVVRDLRKIYPDILADPDLSELDVIALAALLRKAWTETDPRRAEWFVFLIRYLHSENARRLQDVKERGGERLLAEWWGKKARLDTALANYQEQAAPALCQFVNYSEMRAVLENPGPPTGKLESALSYLQRNIRLGRARRCQNSECTSVCPYFFSTRDKYCSDSCKQQKQKEYKRNWWASSGAEWKKNRSKKSKKRRKR